MSNYQLRGYQSECITAVLDAWDGGMSRPGVVLPTGTGKTVILAALCDGLVQQGLRPLLLVNRDELANQSAEKLRGVNAYMNVGIVKAGQDQWDTDVTVGSVQTLSRKARMERIPEDHYDVIICDEAHFAASDSWQRVLTYFGAFKIDEPTRCVGFTATMIRTDKKVLGDTWDDIVFYRDTQWAIEHGFLVRPRAQTVKLDDLDLSKVKSGIGGFDYQDGDLGRAMAQADACPLIAAAYDQHGRNAAGELRRGIIFAPTVELTHCLADDFNALGIPTAVVLGDTPTAERQAIYESVRRGITKVIASCGVLVYGFDLPAMEVAVMARPTKSPLVYIQAVGRVLRPSPETGKLDALILDVVGAARIGLASPVDLGLAECEVTDETGKKEVVEGRVVLPGLRPEVPDEVEFVEIDPFAGVRKQITPRGRTPWLLTYDQIPFLPGKGDEPSYALFPANASEWAVWAVPNRGKPTQVVEPRAFPLAAQAALRHYGPKPALLKGEASDNQRLYLARFGVDATGMDKQQASDAIAIAKMSARRKK